MFYGNLNDLEIIRSRNIPFLSHFIQIGPCRFSDMPLLFFIDSFTRPAEFQALSCFNFYENSSILVFCDNINFTLSRKTDIPVNDFVSDFLKIIGCNIFTFFSCYFSLKSNDSLLLKPILQKDHLQKVISMLFQHNL